MAKAASKSKKPIDSIISQKDLRKGLSIYKTGRSPYWYVRLRDPLLGKYKVKSTKETSRVDAIEAAEEFAESYRRRSDGPLALVKTTSFEHYAKLLMETQRSKSKWLEGENKLLNRSKDGLIVYFGKHDVTKITTGMIREYLLRLDQNRDKPLAKSTKSKHVIIIRKVLTLAVEDGLMQTIPPMPKIKTVDSPRHSFTDGEYRRFCSAATECAKRKDVVRGVQITGHHVKMFKFIVHSFLRPTEGELFGLKHKDVEAFSNPNHLRMHVRNGKTGGRVSATMPLAVPLYGTTVDPRPGQQPDPNDYVWMPEYPNRTTAINTARRLFNHILKAASLDDPEKKLSPYSLRHYALQARLRGSKGKVNVYMLAQNAGTSVDQLERFYLKRMEPTAEMIENLHTSEEPIKRDRRSSLDHLSFVDEHISSVDDKDDV